MLTRRAFMGTAAVLGAGALLGCGSGRSQPSAVLTSDFSVPHADPDDYYDVACAIALGFTGVVLDQPSPDAISAIEEIGGRVLEPTALRKAESICVVGSPGPAAAHHRREQRVILFAGDATGAPEHNQALDPEAYAFLQPRSRWVPCFAGSLQPGDRRASLVWTNDDELAAGSPLEPWLRKFIGDVWGFRRLWGGALLRFAFADRWAGSSVASGRFEAAPDLAKTMVAGVRALLR